jgi:hypothetical protein
MNEPIKDHRQVNLSLQKTGGRLAGFRVAKEGFLFFAFLSVAGQEKG